MCQPLHLRRKAKNNRKFCLEFCPLHLRTLQENPHGQRSLAGYSSWGCRVRHNWETKHSTGVTKSFILSQLAVNQHQIKALNCSSWEWTVLKGLGESEQEVLDMPRRQLNWAESFVNISIFAMQNFCWRYQFSSVTQSCLTLCDPMDCNTPGLPVHHQLPEFTQTHVHWVSDASQPSHPLLSRSPTFNLSQHQGLFQCQFFTSGGQSIGVSTSASVLPVDIQDWFPLGWTNWISLQPKGLFKIKKRISWASTSN